MVWKPSELSTTELSTAIGTGNREAEAEFYTHYQTRVWILVERALSPGPDSEDLTSEILQDTIVCLREGRFRGECQLGTFVHAVSRNKIAAFLRKRRPVTAELSENIPDEAPSPVETAQSAEMARVLRDTIGELKPKYRQVLYLYYFRGQTVAEIAATQDETPKRISEWKNYALKLIRSRYEGDLIGFR